MKKVIIIILVLTLTNFASKATDSSSIVVSYVDRFWNTSKQTSCDQFETEFKKLLSIQVLTNRDSVNVVGSLLNKAQYSHSNRSIDVRCRISYKESANRQRILCFDGNNILLDGCLLKKNKQLISFINSITKWKETPSL